MANQRKEGKKKLQIWLDEQDRLKLKELSEAHGFDSVTAFIQAVADGTIGTNRHPKSKSNESKGKKNKPPS